MLFRVEGNKMFKEKLEQFDGVNMNRVKFECKSMIDENRLSIHIESGDILFDNENIRESIYSLMYVQQNYKKKLLKLELFYTGGFDSYLYTYLTAIKSINDDKYDMLTHKIY